MTLKQTKEKGFTIVELLIVIVVIAILAAITIVAYNGIQNRAKASAAQSAANTIIKKAEAANAAGTNGYPQTIAHFQAVKEGELTGSGITLAAITAAPASPSTVEYLPCTTTAGAAARVAYWDYSAATPAKKSVDIGGSCTTWGTTALTGGPTTY